MEVAGQIMASFKLNMKIKRDTHIEPKGNPIKFIFVRKDIDFAET